MPFWRAGTPGLGCCLARGLGNRRSADVPHLHIDQRTLFGGEWRVFAPARAANPAAGRVDAFVVGKFAFEHQDFLAARMPMPAELRVRRPADQCGADAIVFMNPPYGGVIGHWMRKAYEASRGGATVVCLVPARTDTAWWHHFAMRGEVRLLRGRLKFGTARNSAPFPSAVVVFRPPSFALKEFTAELRGQDFS